MNNILQYISRAGISWLGEETVRKLYANGSLASVADIYLLNTKSFKEIGFSVRNARKLNESIHATRSMPFAMVMTALTGIPYNHAETLAEKYQNWDTVKLCTLADFTGAGLPEQTAKDLCYWIQSPENKNTVRKLKTILNFGEVKRTSNKLAGAVFFICGKFNLSQTDLRKFIADNGGKASENIYSSNFFLIGAACSTEIINTAKQLNLRKITEEYLIDYCDGKNKNIQEDLPEPQGREIIIHAPDFCITVQDFIKASAQIPDCTARKTGHGTKSALLRYESINNVAQLFFNIGYSLA